ncbi:MAG: phosphoglycerate kinase [Thermodesulfobacteriota bacterium]
MKNIRDLDIANKRLLIRVDFNVPLDGDGNISDDTRILGVLATLRYALEQQAKVIIMSHMGRPKGQRNEKFTMAPAAQHLAQLLAVEVAMAPDCIGPEVEELVMGMKPGQVLMLENLRFYGEETANDPEFAQKLANLAEVYVNDAFAVSHRAHASVVGVPAQLNASGAGFLLQKEMDFFHQAVEAPRRPLAAVVGGAKVSSKLGALTAMMERVDKMIIGGAMANTFLKAQGHDVGASLVEDDLLATARELMVQAEKLGVKLYLPVDVVAAQEFSATAVSKRCPIQEIPADWLALDIGPASTILFNEALDTAQTVVWNGPMGAFETDPYSRGTSAMVMHLACSPALTIVGGGDTNAAVNLAGEKENFSYMSTGGGAFLMLMEGKELPGVTVLA